MISSDQVRSFKRQHCDENKTIISLINSQLQKYFLETILDVGCGIGDIAYACWKNKKAYLIDTNPKDINDSPIRNTHRRYQCDFYKFYAEDIKTVFISHTLQFIDHDFKQLNSRLELLDPQFLIFVLNNNVGFLGELISWIESNYPDAHPEKRLNSEISKYQKLSSVQFESSINCKDYSELAEQLQYMMLIPSTDDLTPLINWLKQALKAPTFSFYQSIDIYEKNIKKRF